MQKVFNNRTIRKFIVAFGNLFNNISIARYNTDGSEEERFLVPIAFAPKEKYVQRIEEDPNIDKKVQMTLPRMSYVMNGFEYDASRKQLTNVKNYFQTPSGPLSQYNPIPYNFNFVLYIYVRHYEDVTQIAEYIMSFFTPDYTIKLNLVPEMGIVKDIPITLDSFEEDVEYEGTSESDPRLIIWTLNFTLQGFIFGSVNDTHKNLILHSITNIFDDFDPSNIVAFNMNSGTGDYQIGEMVYQGYSINSATATATVKDWSNNKLTLNNFFGNFVSNLPVIGINSGTHYKFSSFEMFNSKVVRIDTVPEPFTSNVLDPWTANSTITEFG